MVDALSQEDWFGADGLPAIGPDGFSSTIEYVSYQDDLSEAILIARREYQGFLKEHNLQYSTDQIELRAQQLAQEENLVGTKYFDDEGNLIGILPNDQGYPALEWGQFAFDPLHWDYQAAGGWMSRVDQYAFWSSRVGGISKVDVILETLDEDYRAANDFDRRKRERAFHSRADELAEGDRPVLVEVPLLVGSYDFDRQRFKIRILLTYGELRRGDRQPRTLGWEEGSGSNQVALEYFIEGNRIPTYWDLPEEQAEAVLNGERWKNLSGTFVLKPLHKAEYQRSERSGSMIRVRCKLVGLVIAENDFSAGLKKKVIAVLPGGKRTAVRMPLLPEKVFNRPLGERLRRQIFWDLFACEDLNPTSTEQTGRCIKWMCDEHLLSRNAVLGIIKEGHELSWPMPD